MSAPPTPPRPTVNPNAGLPAKEELHHVAATLAAAVGNAFKLDATSLDPTFKDAQLSKLVLTIWGAHQTYYAALLAALKDSSWGSPEVLAQPVTVPTPTPAPTTPPTAPTGPQPTSIPALVASLTGQGS
jgi:hypothetical protein